MIPKFQREDGTVTRADDPLRAIWYGVCSYWTDDWSALLLLGPGIPCCPHCQAPGFIISAEKWFDGPIEFEADNPGYAAFLVANKAACHGKTSMNQLWLEHRKAQS